MAPTARTGTFFAASFLVACSSSHATTSDAALDTGVDEGTCSPTQRAGATLDGPRLGASLAGEGPWTGTIANVGADGVDLVLDDGVSARFAWIGTSVAGLSAGMSATIARDGRWTVLSAGGVRLHALDAQGFVGDGLVGAPMTVDGAPTLTLVEACRFREGGGGCDQPPAMATVYALDVGGTRLDARGRSAGAGYEVYFLGAVQLPGYGSSSCVVEAAFAARVAVRVTDVATCADIEAEYRRVVRDGSACAIDDECMVLSGQCGVGLGGCYEATSRDVSSVLGELGRQFAELGCTSAVCDCDDPPGARCDGFYCTLMR